MHEKAIIDWLENAVLEKSLYVSFYNSGKRCFAINEKHFIITRGTLDDFRRKFS